SILRLLKPQENMKLTKLAVAIEGGRIAAQNFESRKSSDTGRVAFSVHIKLTGSQSMTGLTAYLEQAKRWKWYQTQVCLRFYTVHAALVHPLAHLERSQSRHKQEGLELLRRRQGSLAGHQQLYVGGRSQLEIEKAKFASRRGIRGD